MSNLLDVQSADHFKELLSADLSRVSVINFWAEWAAPCGEMNTLVKKLAKEHDKVLFLQVEAEVQADITESFDVESVPTIIVLRGHTLLAKIAGVDEQALTNALIAHANAIPASSRTQPSNQITSPPTVQETDEQLVARIKGLLNQSKVVLFMKGSPDAPRCGFSRKAVNMLREKAVKFSHFDILTDEAVRQRLKVINDWPTYPQIIVNGELVGGVDILEEMVKSGEFDEVFTA